MSFNNMLKRRGGTAYSSIRAISSFLCHSVILYSALCIADSAMGYNLGTISNAISGGTITAAASLMMES